MIKYWQDNSARMMQLTIEHARMVLIALFIAFLVAIVLIAVFLRKKNWMNSLIYFFSLLYSVPSYTGIREVDPNYIEVARGMGMTQEEIFTKVQLPLSMPAIFSGLQVALASTMAIATIASTISAGGLGDLMFEGLQTGRVVSILWGTILTVALTLVCIVILKLIENLVISDGLEKS